MSDPESDIHAALMAHAQVAEAALPYPFLWPQKGGSKPAAEHIRVAHVPNDNAPADLSSDVMERQGFLYLTLVSELGQHEVVTKRKAGQIAAYFKRGQRLTINSTTVKITGHTVRSGRQEGRPMGNAHSHQLLEHGMTTKKDDTNAEARKAPAKPARAELVNADKRNGQIGQIARPLEKDAAAWLGKGWQRKSAGNAE